MSDILIVDDESGFAESLAELLELESHEVRVAATLAAARDQLAKRCPDLLLLDLMLPDGSGLELLEQFGDQRPGHTVIVTGNTAVRTLIGGIAGDGVSYLRKPVEARDIQGLLNMLDEGEEAPRTPDREGRFGLLVGESLPMQRLFEQIRQVAVTDSTVFIQGESGTGKELVAEMIHRTSRREGAFIPVNCGGLSKDLISSQLFGHEKGSFTGAEKQHAGYFERANDGTLFLDELTEMPIEMQVHLLRVLETGKVNRLGSERDIEVNARLVAATNRNPAEAVKEGLLREDLYFRLSVIPLVIPPLRERHGDVEVLARHFLDEFSKQDGKQRVMSDEFCAAIRAHHWPGNVRELKHAVHRAAILSPGELVEPPPGFLLEPTVDQAGPAVGRSIADVEKELILSTLEHFDGQKQATASTLGISLKTLYNRLKSYEIEDEG